jgi:hypothetical protein
MPQMSDKNDTQLVTPAESRGRREPSTSARSQSRCDWSNWMPRLCSAGVTSHELAFLISNSIKVEVATRNMITLPAL